MNIMHEEEYIYRFKFDNIIRDEDPMELLFQNLLQEILKNIVLKDSNEEDIFISGFRYAYEKETVMHSLYKD